jgi:hypothetical protein
MWSKIHFEFERRILKNYRAKLAEWFLRMNYYTTHTPLRYDDKFILSIMRFSFATLLLYIILFLSCVLNSVYGLSRDEIAKKLKDTGGSVNTGNKKENNIDVKTKMASNKRAQKLKQDIRNAKKQNKKDLRKARKNRGEL